jgi:hypothetical protein
MALLGAVLGFPDLGPVAFPALYHAACSDPDQAEFPMPADVVRPSLRNIKIGRLLDLKQEWGVSMQALIERAHPLDLLSPSQRTSLYKMFSVRGWRIREPGSEELAPERPQLPQDIARSLAARGLSALEVSTIAGFANPSSNILFRTAGLRAI